MNERQLSLFDSLADCLEYLDSIENINAGGCGISALAIYRWCKKHQVRVGKHPFVILLSDEYEVKHNNACIESGDLLEIDYPHIVIEIYGTLYDSGGDEYESGSIQAFDNYRQEYQFNESELLELINEGSWNHWFSRENVPDIADALGIDLSDVEGW